MENHGLRDGWKHTWHNYNGIIEMNEKTLRLAVFCVISAGIVAMSYLKQDTAPLVAILTYLLKNPFAKEVE